MHPLPLALDAIYSKAVILLFFVHFSFAVPIVCVRVCCVMSWFCDIVLCDLFSFAMILLKRENWLHKFDCIFAFKKSLFVHIPMALLHNAIGWSVICECDFFPLYQLGF